jgi:tetratricopeptide (TPR) repeat protein
MHERKPRLPDGIPATGSEAEQKLIRAIETCPPGDRRSNALLELGRYYFYEAQRVDLAIAILNLMVRDAHDPEQAALLYLALGQIAEEEQQWGLALQQYTRGLSTQARDHETVYLLFDSAGHCLNNLGRYVDAETYCRSAIAIDSTKGNAFKELGLSLEGQGDLIGAAWAWVEGTNADPEDQRSMNLLKRLICNHPRLLKQWPWIEQELTHARDSLPS